MTRWISAVVFTLAVALTAGAATLAQQGGMSDEEMAKTFFDLIHSQDYAYTWHYETDVAPGFYKGTAPHGEILRTFMNDIAYDAATAKAGLFPPNSMIVKENHMAGDFTVETSDKSQRIEGFSGNLDAITYMVKIDGYNPEGGDWFWAKMGADGSIAAAGKPDGCIGCHSQVADNDWVYDASVK